MKRELLALALLALAIPACGGDDQSCPGCIDSTGQCIPVLSAASCGVSGGACVVCASDERCISGTCTKEPCGPSNCAGCCQAGQCIQSSTEAACGTGGVGCVTCDATEQCQSGQCKALPCGPTTCATGCCFNGTCLPGTNPGGCGTSGSSCQTCQNNEVCANQQCKVVACNATTCATGCCDGQGSCETGNSEAACGTGGQACQACKSNEACTGTGTCEATSTQCNATTCATGCCDNLGNCVPGNTSPACGTGGAACAVCGSSQGCVSGKCTCTTTSCTGCCEGDFCKPGFLDATCGQNGSPCQQCASGTKCFAGKCAKGCDWSTCPTGCCEGDVCKPGTDLAACGIAGIACQKCGAFETCNGGVCNDSFLCSSSNCSNCCKNSACQAGTADLACGAGGKTCTICPFFKSCVASTCKIKPTSTWAVTLVEVEVDATLKCDYAFPTATAALCDVKVELKVGGQSKTSNTISDTNNPVFNEYMLTATAADLMGTIQIRVLDFDPIGGDDLIADCSNTIFESELDGGSATIYYCGSSSDLKQIKFAFTPVP